MCEIYNAISQNRIATLHLDTVDGILTPSVQIPAPFFVADLPTEDDERHRGLWLTTANAFLSQDALEEPGFLDRNFALLLLDDEKKIVAELQNDRDPTTLAMIEFVRLAKPTMSSVFLTPFLIFLPSLTIFTDLTMSLEASIKLAKATSLL